MQCVTGEDLQVMILQHTFELSTLFFILMYDLSVLLKLAWRDFAPCSPIDSSKDSSKEERDPPACEALV